METLLNEVSYYDQKEAESLLCAGKLKLFQGDRNSVSALNLSTENQDW
jgi:hypothetical protein